MVILFYIIIIVLLLFVIHFIFIGIKDLDPWGKTHFNINKLYGKRKYDGNTYYFGHPNEEHYKPPDLKNGNKGRLLENELSNFVILIKLPSLIPPFKLSKENVLARFFKFIGLSKELQLGLDNFDRRVYIEQTDASWIKHWLRNREVRKGIIKILALGWKNIRSDGNTLLVEWVNKDESYGRNMPHFEETVAAMFSLVNAFPKETVQPITAIQSQWHMPYFNILYLALTVGAAIFLFGNYSTIETIHFYEVVNDYLSLCIISFIILSIIFFLIYRGHAESHKVWLKFTLISVVFVPSMIFGSVIFINSEYDTQKKEHILYPILNKHIRKVHHSGSRFNKWEIIYLATTPLKDFSISKYDYNKITNDTDFYYYTLVFQGYLGYAWRPRGYYEIRTKLITFQQ